MKNKKTPKITVPDWKGYVIGSHLVKILEGELLTLVEAISADNTQREALKSIIRRTIWKWFDFHDWQEEVKPVFKDKSLN